MPIRNVQRGYQRTVLGRLQGKMTVIQDLTAPGMRRATMMSPSLLQT
ncbi:hypothetical protein E2C01_102102 [Portunus trituberculatus]|uniref:Uncharacterized protein n=1 Tax=Portunus trituberculatus TaxID=210409 RepID=A0A5B7KHN4_PORTR|nr:hypothetical protein [Portunus trituberculatus]